MNWFEVSKDGLNKILARKGREWVIFELLQNSLDEDTTRVDITLQRVPGSKYAVLTVTDDAPNGFADLSHAFTLFAESNKKGDVSKRGRFCIGEKLTLALATEASIKSTTGTVVFDSEGRRRTGSKTDRGSVFTAKIRMTADEMEQCGVAIRTVLVPAEVAVTFNGQSIASRKPVHMARAALQTEIADEEGCLRKSTRTTDIEIYEVEDGAEACLFELGIPVTTTADRFHVNILQKVPLSMDRVSVPVAYLAKVRAAVLEATAQALDKDDANSTWVKEAMQRHGEDLKDDTVQRILGLRFGEKRVAYDPSDMEANHLAASKGYTIVYGSQLSKQEWDAVRRVGAIRPAGQVTPSPRPYSEGGKPLALVDKEDWTPAMRVVADYAKAMGSRLLGIDIEVRIAREISWPFAATYGGRMLTFNLGRLGHKWFEGDLVAINDLLLHEIAHEIESSHLSDGYYKALSKLGAQMTSLALRHPSMFEAVLNHREPVIAKA